MDRMMVACGRAGFLMCPPLFFGVDYVINPWMSGNCGAVDRKAAARQWVVLVHILRDELGASLLALSPVEGAPDMVFTANAALVRDHACVLARFRHPERRPEEPRFRQWFVENGYAIGEVPDGLSFEGAGDSLFDEGDRSLLWAAFGFRTDVESHAFLTRFFGCQVKSLELVDPRFYHLDTCFCPLPGGLLIWYPPAFGASSQEVICNTVAPAHRYAVNAEAAGAFICNAVCAGAAVVANSAPEASIAGLRAWLAERGLALRTTCLTEFMKAGGSAKCLTIRVQ